MRFRAAPFPPALRSSGFPGRMPSTALLALTHPLPKPRTAALRTLRRPEGGIIDQGLVLWFPGPKSETGEDMVELQVHGGSAVIQAIFGVLSGRLLRLAEPGEFIRRAFRRQRRVSKMT